MALSKGSMESSILSKLESLGIKSGGVHGRAWIAPKAVADGVVTAITSTAVVVVPYRAGGSYPVTGLSSAVMSSRIAAVLQANGINFSGAHAQGDILPDAVANAVTAQVLGSCTAAVPKDGVGTFQVTGLSESALKSNLESEFRAKNIVLTGAHAYAGRLVTAIANGVAARVNADATITGNWYYAAGTAPVE